MAAILSKPQYVKSDGNIINDRMLSCELFRITPFHHLTPQVSILMDSLWLISQPADPCSWADTVPGPRWITITRSMLKYSICISNSELNEWLL